MRGRSVWRGYWPLVLLIAAAIGVPLIILGTTSITTYRDIERSQLATAVKSAEALSEHALRTFRAQEIMIDMLNQMTWKRPWPQLRDSAELSSMLARFVSREPDIGAIVFTGPDGNETLSSSGPHRNTGVSQRDFFIALRDSPALERFLSVPATGPVSGEQVVTLAKRRTGADGSFEGVLFVVVRVSYFQSMYSGLLRDPDDAISLVRSDGVLMARGPAWNRQMKLPPDSGLMKAIRSNPERGQFHTRSVMDNVERLYAYEKVGDYPVYVSVSRSRSALWAEWRGRMIPYVVLCAVAAMLLLLLAAWLVWRHYRSELAAMRRLAEEASLRSRVEADKASLEADSRSKDAFLAGLSHELRNPVGAIALAVETLDRSMARDGGPAEQALRILGNQTRQLRSLLEDMLDLAGAIHGKLVLKSMPMELKAFLGELAAGWKSSEGNSLRISVSGVVSWVRADAARLQQVFLNLLDNAAKYGAHEVRIDIAASGSAAGGTWVEVSVADDGEGIASEFFPSLFEPFARGPNAGSRSGLGLGLALIKRLVALHGGSLAGHSEGPGKGARFVVRLPAIRAEDAHAVMKAGHPDRNAPLRVLVVDDQADSRESLKLVLQIDGHQVATAAGGEEALGRLEADRPDVVFCDIGMPVMDGYRFAEQARLLESGQHAILVALSGYGADADRERSRRAGFDFYLVKPASMADISGVLEAAASGAGAGRVAQAA